MQAAWGLPLRSCTVQTEVYEYIGRGKAPKHPTAGQDQLRPGCPRCSVGPDLMSRSRRTTASSGFMWRGPDNLCRAYYSTQPSSQVGGGTKKMATGNAEVNLMYMTEDGGGGSGSRAESPERESVSAMSTDTMDL